MASGLSFKEQKLIKKTEERNKLVRYYNVFACPKFGIPEIRIKKNRIVQINPEKTQKT